MADSTHLLLPVKQASSGIFPFNATRPDSFQQSFEPLFDRIRHGLEELLTGMLETEVEGFTRMHRHLKGSDGLRRVVRNGYQKERTVTCGIGEIRVSVPRTRDRRTGDDEKVVFHSRIIPRYMRKVAELDRYVLALYIKGMQNGDFSDLYTLLLNENEENSLSETPEFLFDFSASRRRRPPKWHLPEGFKWPYKVDWKRYWKWKGTELKPITLKRKRKWWIRWGNWDGLNRRTETNRRVKTGTGRKHSGLEEMRPVTGEILTHMSGHTPYGFANLSQSVMIKQSELNIRVFQTGFPQFRRAA